MEIEQHIVGFTEEGEVILRYTLTNSCGMVVTLLNYGAAIESIKSPAGNHLTITYPSYKDYISDSLMMGKCVGRCAGRIAKGAIDINGIKYRLSTNEGTTHLNGGVVGFSSRLWQARSEQDMVVMSYLSPASEEGYPSELGVEVGFTLTENNELSVTVMAASEGTTIVNIVPYVYFSYSDGDMITINGDMYLELNRRGIPNGELLPTKETIYDFSAPKRVDNEYDDYWIIELDNDNVLKEHATLYRSGVEVNIRSTQPVLNMSSCSDIEGCGYSIYGEELQNGDGVLLVPLNVPFDTADRLLLNEGDKYHHQTVYAFKFF